MTAFRCDVPAADADTSPISNLSASGHHPDSAAPIARTNHIQRIDGAHIDPFTLPNEQTLIERRSFISHTLENQRTH
jgi:hypothetical protein